MKQFKGSVIAALVLVLVIGGIYLVEVRWRGGSVDGERALPGFEAGDVVSFELRYPKAAFRFRQSGRDGAGNRPIWEVLRASPADAQARFLETASRRTSFPKKRFHGPDQVP